MNELERVIKGLECCLDEGSCHGCPYYDDMDYCDGSDTLKRDALALLKAQEPVKPKRLNGYVYCGRCGYKLHWIVEQNNFCQNCGRAVKWE